jgi:hypothetical protein
MSGFYDFLVSGGVANTEGVIMETVTKSLGVIESSIKTYIPDFKLGAEDFGLFGAMNYWDKVYSKIGDINKDLGISGNLGASMKKEFKDAYVNLSDMGIESEEISKNLKKFLEDSGRAMIVSSQELVEMSQMVKVFGDDSIDILSTYRGLGLSIQTTTSRMKQLTIESNKYGVLPSKAVKQIKDNLSAVDKYYFKGGTKAFEQMALKAASLNNDMKGAFTMIDKILDGGIEGAVEMAQEMQLMGGPIAQMGDVFGLIQKALSGDVEAFTTDIAKAAAQMASINAEGEIMFDPASMMQFRQLASKVGVDIGEITKLGRTMAKEMDVSKQLDLSLRAVPAEFEAMSRKVAGAVKGKDAFGNWVVTIDGIEKKVQDLTKADIETKLSMTTEGVSPEDTFKEIVKSNMSLAEVMNTFVQELKKSALAGAGDRYNEFLNLNKDMAKNAAETFKPYIDEYSNVTKKAYDNLFNVMKPLSEGDFGTAMGQVGKNLTEAGTDLFNAGSQALYEVSKVVGNVLWNAGKLIITSITYGFDYGIHRMKMMLYDVWNRTAGSLYAGSKVDIPEEEKNMKSFSQYLKDAEFSNIFEGADFGEVWNQLTKDNYEALEGLNEDQSAKVREKIPEDKYKEIQGKQYMEVSGTIMLKSGEGQRELTKEENIQLLKDINLGTLNKTNEGD